MERLVRIAYRTIGVAEDNDHSDGKAFSPDDRDRAQNARSVAFNRLYDTPGRATFDALLRFAATGLSVPAEHLRKLARDRAAHDAEGAAWPAEHVRAYELSAETTPTTAGDLQAVALSRLEDIQDELVNGDFNQGRTVSALPDETAVQNWVASRLRDKQGRSYSIERESHVADEKEPDVRLRAKASDANVPMEIKVAESWSINELERALRHQLCRQYLRVKDTRHRVLLLVHQKARPRGWRDPKTGKYLTFVEVVARLRRQAAEISCGASDAPQPMIAVLDISGSKPSTTTSERTSRRIRQKSRLPADALTLGVGDNEKPGDRSLPQ